MPKARYREDWKRESCIVNSKSKPPHHSSCWSHGGKCSPGILNLVDVTKQSCEYTRIISPKHVFELYRKAKKKRLTVSQIKSALHDLVPKTTEVTTQQVFNLRVKVLKLLPIIEQNPEYENCRQYINDNQIVHGLDDALEINDDLAHNVCIDL